MNISIVIINYNTRDLLRQCLESIAKTHPEVDDIIVVDNNSPDDSVAMLKKEFSQIKLVASPINAGFGRGVNMGITNAKNDNLLFINPDIVINSGVLHKLIEELERPENNDIALIAPRLVHPDGTPQDSARRFQRPLDVVLQRTPLGKTGLGQKRVNRFLMKDQDLDQSQNVDWVVGGCILVRRRAIEQVGEMDERYFMYMEDMDWCRRFWRAGWRVHYYPHVTVAHHHRRESRKNRKLAWIHLKSGGKYFMKYLGSPSRKVRNDY
ncbi:glycosyltransferase family 2 protein [Patescibacteria group bacterium]